MSRSNRSDWTDMNMTERSCHLSTCATHFLWTLDKMDAGDESEGFGKRPLRCARLVSIYGCTGPTQVRSGIPLTSRVQWELPVAWSPASGTFSCKFNPDAGSFCLWFHEDFNLPHPSLNLQKVDLKPHVFVSSTILRLKWLWFCRNTGR